MKALVHKSYLFQGFLGALFINLVLFCSLPGLINIKTDKNDLESLNVVNFIRIKPDPPKLKPRGKPPKKKFEKKPEKIYRTTRKKPRKVARQQLKLNMPAMDLNIDPRISGGIPLISLPPGPKVKALAPQPDFNLIMDQSEVYTIPLPKFKMNPQYPYRAKRMGLDGIVRIKFLVDKEGNVSDITILEARPPEIFNQSVLKAVSTWKYSPGELLGRQVATMVTTSIIFKLEGQ